MSEIKTHSTHDIFMTYIRSNFTEHTVEWDFHTNWDFKQVKSQFVKKRKQFLQNLKIHQLNRLIFEF